MFRAHTALKIEKIEKLQNASTKIFNRFKNFFFRIEGVRGNKK